MSIRIDSDKLSGAAGLQTGQVDQVRSGATKTSATRGTRANGRDLVEMSSMAEGITDASAAQNQANASRVRQLSAAYASGQYEVGSLQLSRAMINNSITGSGSGGK